MCHSSAGSGCHPDASHAVEPCTCTCTCTCVRQGLHGCMHGSQRESRMGLSMHARPVHGTDAATQLRCQPSNSPAAPLRVRPGNHTRHAACSAGHQGQGTRHSSIHARTIHGQMRVRISRIRRIMRASPSLGALQVAFASGTTAPTHPPRQVCCYRLLGQPLAPAARFSCSAMHTHRDREAPTQCRP